MQHKSINYILFFLLSPSCISTTIIMGIEHMILLVTSYFVQEVVVPVLEQLLVEWLLAQPCYLLFRLLVALAQVGGVAMRRPPGLAWAALPGYAVACARSGGRMSTCELQNFLGQ
jgi:hypothetical protein